MYIRDLQTYGAVPAYHEDVIKWKHFPRYWPFVRGIHRSPVNSPHKGQWRGALMFSLICARINGWVNNGEAGDLRRNRAHYDVTLMMILLTLVLACWGPSLGEPRPNDNTLGSGKRYRSHPRNVTTSCGSLAPVRRVVIGWDPVVMDMEQHLDARETLSALLVCCEGNLLITGGFPSQGPVMRSFGVSLLLAWISCWKKQSSGQLF